jgi:hypothetical protein
MEDHRGPMRLYPAIWHLVAQNFNIYLAIALLGTTKTFHGLSGF